MQINLFLIPFVVILGLLFKDNKNNRLIYIIICSVVLVFVAAMRSPEWMTYTYQIDTLKYKAYFEYSLNLPWSDAWSSAKERYIVFGNEDDIGFLFLNKFIGLFTHDFYVFSLLADLIFFIPFSIILYRYCNSKRQVIFAFVFYIALIQIMLLGGGRQNFSVGFDLMALMALINHKKLYSVLLFLIGITIHFSSLLFIIPLLMIWFDANPKVLKILHIVFFVLFPISLIIPNTIITFLANFVGMQKYAEYGNYVQGGATNFIILIEILSLFCLVAIKQRDMKNSETLKYFYVMAPLFTFFAPLIHSNGVMMRVSLYFHLFLTLLVPYAIDCMFNSTSRRIVYLIVIGLLAFLAMQGGGTQYYFYWQYI